MTSKLRVLNSSEHRGCARNCADEILLNTRIRDEHEIVLIKKSKRSAQNWTDQIHRHRGAAKIGE